MPAQWISAGAAVLGAYGSYRNSKKNSGPTGAASSADPFAGERGQYQDQLQSLMTGQFNPTDPSYQWRFNQGLEGVNRTSAGSGLLHSGNRLAALTDYGQGLASTEYGNQFARLARLAGADIGSPSTAAQMQYKQSGDQAAGIMSLGNQFASLLGGSGGSSGGGGGMGSWFGNLFGGGGGGGSTSGGDFNAMTQSFGSLFGGQ